MKKAKTLSPILPKAKDSLLKLSHFSVPPERRAEFKSGMLAAAGEAIEAFPKQLEAVKDELRRCLPPSALAAFVAYGLQAGLSKDGKQKSLLPNVLQHHAELLQALMLTMPLDEWGQGPLMPEISQKLFDTVPTLSDTFFMQRLLEGERVESDPDALLIQSIQNRMRMHTHGVRNWGYYQQVVQTSRGLYAGLDAAMTQHHGFSATDVIGVLAAMVSECEKRQAAHFDLLRKVLRC